MGRSDGFAAGSSILGQLPDSAWHKRCPNVNTVYRPRISPYHARRPILSFTLLYWHWLTLGLILIMAELFIPSFTIFWFGLGGLLVGVILWIIPETNLNWQLFIWAVASSGFTFLWFKLIKPRMIDRTKAGLSREAVLGESGQVIAVPLTEKRGTVRFTTPLLGSDEWPFICEQETALGDRVFIKDVSGNTLIVEKRDK
jgi:inner membrane protein